MKACSYIRDKGAQMSQQPNIVCSRNKTFLNSGYGGLLIKTGKRAKQSALFKTAVEPCMTFISSICLQRDVKQYEPRDVWICLR